MSVCVFRRQRRDVSIAPYTPEETGAISHGIAAVRTWPIGLGSVAADEHYTLRGNSYTRDHPLSGPDDVVSRWPRRNAYNITIICGDNKGVFLPGRTRIFGISAAAIADNNVLNAAVCNDFLSSSLRRKLPCVSLICVPAIMWFDAAIQCSPRWGPS